MRRTNGVQGKQRRAKGGSSVRWVAAKRLWEARASYRTSDGVRRYKSVYRADKFDANDAFDRLRQEYGGGTVSRDAGASFEAYLNAWLVNIAESKQPKTVRLHRMYVEDRIVPMLGRKHLASIGRR